MRESRAAEMIRILHPPESLETLEPGLLAVAYSGDAPTDYVNAGRLLGIHGEVRRRVAEILGLGVKAIAMPFPSMLPALRAREIDLPGIGTGWHAERARIFRYTQPYQYFFFGLAHSAGQELNEIGELIGHRITAIDGSFNNDELGKCVGLSNVKFHATLDQVVADLIHGVSEAAVYDHPNIKLALARHELGGRFRVSTFRFDARYPLTTGRFPNHLLFHGDAVRLHAAACLAVDLLKTSGELSEIYRRYTFADEHLLSIVQPTDLDCDGAVVE